MVAPLALTVPSRRSSSSQRVALFFLFVLVSLLIFVGKSSAGTGGSISGTVTDPSGAVVIKASVTAKNLETGITLSVTTDAKGFYSFPALTIGHYDLEISSSAFRPYRRTSIIVDANSALTINAFLSVGERTDAVTVEENQVQVETTSTQNGQVINARQLTTVPLNGRSYTDLLTLQPGVAPATSVTSDTVQDVGASVLSPSGDLNPGTISINGQREFANSFIVNGSDVEEDVNMGAAVIPNLDSIAEFRILTNNFDAEYGEFSGGQINVVTKSGTNQFHGDAFEFLRNTDLDARNYFSPERGTFDQNQFGGTIGGPIRKNKIFFFADYQGTRSTQGVDTGEIPVPSRQDRTTGNFSDLPANSSGFNPMGFCGTQSDPNTNQVYEIPCTVSGPNVAAMLSNQLGHTVTPGDPYFYSGNYIDPSTNQESG